MCAGVIVVIVCVCVCVCMCVFGVPKLSSLGLQLQYQHKMFSLKVMTIYKKAGTLFEKFSSRSLALSQEYQQVTSAVTRVPAGH